MAAMSLTLKYTLQTILTSPQLKSITENTGILSGFAHSPCSDLLTASPAEHDVTVV